MAVAGGASSSVLVSSAKETAALKVNPADVPALEIKLGALVVLLSVTLLFGFAPLCIVRGAGRFSVQPGRLGNIYGQGVRACDWQGFHHFSRRLDDQINVSNIGFCVRSSEHQSENIWTGWLKSAVLRLALHGQFFFFSHGVLQVRKTLLPLSANGFPIGHAS